MSKTDGLKSSGFGMDTAAVKFSATEDLGGGMSINGYMTAASLARGNTVGGEDMGIALMGGFGKLFMGQIEIGSGIRGLGQAGAPVNNMEGEVLSAAVNSDIIKYTSPKFSGMTFSGSFTEGTEVIGGAATGEVLGLGTGIKTAGVKNASSITLGIDYAAGPMAAKLDISNWSDSTKDSRYRLAGAYDLGMAKLGLGFERTKYNTGINNKQTILGVSAPIGAAVTVGAVWAQNKPSVGAKVSGTTLGVQYDLSKRTNVTANTSSWKTAGLASDSKTTVLLNHNF